MPSLSFAAAFGSLLFALHQLTMPAPRTLPRLLLGTLFAVLAIQSVLLGLRLEAIDHPAAPLRPILAMTIGPLLFIHLDSLAKNAASLRPRQLLHALPACLVAVELALGRDPVDVDLAIACSFGAYAAALGRLAFRGEPWFKRDSQDARSSRLIVAATVLMLGSFGTEVGIAREIASGLRLAESPTLLATLICQTSLVALVLFMALRRSPSFASTLQGRQAPRGRNRDGAGGDACAAAFVRLARSERLHAREDVDLRSAAKQLGAGARELSQAINDCCGESFSSYLNRLRVEDAKRLLADRPDLSITDIMFESGFRTKSSFNKEFLARTGCSPSDYRRTGRKP